MDKPMRCDEAAVESSVLMAVDKPMAGSSSSFNLPAARLNVRVSILALMFVLVTYGCCVRRRDSDFAKVDTWTSNGPRLAAAETAAAISGFLSDGTRASCMVEGVLLV